MQMPKSLSNALGYTLLLVGFLILPGCANMPDPGDPEAVAEYMQVNDPLEPLNRQVFAFNQGLDKAVFKPIAETYRVVMPQPARIGVHNFIENLKSPLILINTILQFDLDASMATIGRFLVNSTVGMLGIVDVAGELGVPAQKEDFGQTLAVWGMPSGPYIMLPVLGPSNPRDGLGRVVDYLMDPVNRVALNSDHTDLILARTGMEALVQRAENLDLLNEVEKSSLDFYAAIRSLYRQKRSHEISNGTAQTEAGLNRIPEAPEFPELNGEVVSRR